VGANRDRHRIARRLAALMAYLHGRRYIDIRVIARGLNVSTRTVRRDLEALEAAGIPVPRYRLNAEAA
jgi:predicted DNA-binding transcriptional regulator YafY